MKPAAKVEQILQNMNVTPDPERDRRTLAAVLKAQAETQNESSTQSSVAIRRFFMNNRITQLGAAAIVLIVAGLLISQSFVTPSFAEVIKPIFEANTFAFDTVIGQGGPVMHDRVKGSRFRRTVSNMPDTIMVIDIDNARMLVMDTSDNTASLIDINGQLIEGTRSFINFVRETITRLQQEADNPTQQSERTINGRKAVGYTVGNDREQVSVWADAKTAATIEIELKLGNDGWILKNFEYNIPISDEEVSLDIPAGFTARQCPIDFSNAAETNLVESLRVWARYLRDDGTFPPQLDTQHYMTQVPMLEQKIGSQDLTPSEMEHLGVNFIQGMMFLQTYELRHEGPWQYAGAGVKLGDAESAILWYQPKGSNTYRVIYGDLHIEDIAPEDLPR